MAKYRGRRCFLHHKLAEAEGRGSASVADACRDCGSEFALTPGVRNPTRCPDCRAAATDAKNLRNGRKFRLALFRLTPEEYDELLVSQGGACATCKRTPEEVGRLAVDHDHGCCPGRETCGKCVRGLTCRSCNHALGLLEDDPERIGRLITYLKRSR